MIPDDEDVTMGLDDYDFLGITGSHPKETLSAREKDKQKQKLIDKIDKKLYMQEMMNEFNKYEPYEEKYIKDGYDRFKGFKPRALKLEDVDLDLKAMGLDKMSGVNKEQFAEYLMEAMGRQQQKDQKTRLELQRQRAREEAEKLARLEAAPRLFVHIPKNAGMSIRRSPELKGLIIDAGPERHKGKEYTEAVRKTMDSYGDHHGFEHARARDLDAKLWKDHLAFAIVRNPWERTVSRYLFAKKVIEVEKKVPASYADVSSFEAFLRERYKWGKKKYMWHRAVRGWYNQKDYVTEAPGPVAVLRFEHLDEDLKTFFGDKLPEDFTLKPRNVTAMHDGSYLDYYTPDTADIIEQWYADDIEYFGFDFDMPATQNHIGV